MRKTTDAEKAELIRQLETYIRAMSNFARGKECCERCDGEGYVGIEDDLCPRCGGACLVDPSVNEGGVR